MLGDQSTGLVTVKVWEDSALGLNSNTRLTCWTYGTGVCTSEPQFSLYAKPLLTLVLRLEIGGQLASPSAEWNSCSCVTVKVEIIMVLVPLILVSQHYGSTGCHPERGPH